MQITDPVGAVTSHAYDPLDRLIDYLPRIDRPAFRRHGRYDFTGGVHTLGFRSGGGRKPDHSPSTRSALPW